MESRVLCNQPERNLPGNPRNHRDCHRSHPANHQSHPRNRRVCHRSRRQSRLRNLHRRGDAGVAVSAGIQTSGSRARRGDAGRRGRCAQGKVGLLRTQLPGYRAGIRRIVLSPGKGVVFANRTRASFSLSGIFRTGRRPGGGRAAVCLSPRRLASLTLRVYSAPCAFLRHMPGSRIRTCLESP